MKQRGMARDKLFKLLGNFAPHRFTLANRTGVHACGYRAEQLDLFRHDGVAVRGILTGPMGDWQGLPAILYCHAHGNKYDIGANELIDARPALLSAYAPVLADIGCLAFCIDMPCFGIRKGEMESAASKRHGWFGRSLFGEMIADLRAALDLMSAMPEIDANRIGAFGLSMGATHAFWLAALEPRIKAVAHLCAFADLEALIRAGAHDLHGHYMIVPGLLPEFPAGKIAGMVAPRPQLVGIGQDDPLTPSEAVKPALGALRQAYRDSPDTLAIIEEAETGHIETQAMRDGVIALFTAALNP